MQLSKSSKPKNRLIKLPKLMDNFGLTKSEFDQCADNLEKGVDAYLTEALADQLPESMNYLQNKFRISREDSYDVCMQTFLDFRTKIKNKKIQYGNLRFLYTRMCVNTFIDLKKKEQKIDDAIKNFQVDVNDPIHAKEAFFERLDDLVSELSSDDQSIINEIYYSEKSMQEIAESKGMSYANLRKKKGRLLKALKTNFFSK